MRAPTFRHLIPASLLMAIALLAGFGPFEATGLRGVGHLMAAGSHLADSVQFLWVIFTMEILGFDPRLNDARIWVLGFALLASLVGAGLLVHVVKGLALQFRRVLKDHSLPDAPHRVQWEMSVAPNRLIAANAPYFMVTSVNDESAWEVF